jgi:hypothetical protein
MEFYPAESFFGGIFIMKNELEDIRIPHPNNTIQCHKCTGGSKCIRKYPVVLCSLCHPHDLSIDLYMTEQEIDEYNDKLFVCMDCGVNTSDIKEFYMVKQELWDRVVPSTETEGLLCIGCLEGRLHRQLTKKDFTKAFINDENFFPKSERFLLRFNSEENQYNGRY